MQFIDDVLKKTAQFYKVSSPFDESYGSLIVGNHGLPCCVCRSGSCLSLLLLPLLSLVLMIHPRFINGCSKK